MVATVPSPGTQNPPLSYADRVKKSQGIPPSSAPSSASFSSRPQPRSTATAASAAPAIQKSIPQPSPARNEELPAKQDLPDSPAESVIKPNDLNGGMKSAHVSPLAESTSASAPKVSSPPMVNVWNVRKAQMARGLAPPQSSEPSSSTPSKSAPINFADQSTSLHPTAGVLTNGSATSTSPQNGRTTVSAGSVDVNEAKGNYARDQRDQSQSTGSDPTRLPHLQDAVAWPEVGKIAVAPVIAANRRAGKEREEVKDSAIEKEEAIPGQKKNEKTKWVAIPAEELQAAADAQRASRSPANAHGRSRSHQQSQRSIQDPTHTSGSPVGSTSGRESQTRSRAQSSVTRERRSGSQAGSASQSRTQSRNGSLQSSPRHSAARKRLPEEVAGVLGATNRSLRPSRAGSPQLQIPYPLDQPGASINISSSRPAAGGQLAHPDARSESPYYPAALGLSSHAHTPYASSPAVSSPVAVPYHLSSAHYPPPPLSMSPAYQAGVAPYPMYPPYTYGYGQPYVFWGGSSSGPHSRNISQTHSPSSYAAQLVNPEVNALSPPVGPVVFNPGNTTGGNSIAATIEVEQASQHQLSEKTRPRVLSFGSIDIASAVSSQTTATETSISSNNDSTSSRIDEGTTPTDSASNSLAPSTDPASDKYVPAFSVGLAPGDPGPSRKRITPSSTIPSSATLSSAAVSHLVPGAVDAQISETNDVEALDVRVIDLTVKEPKWEFGTATQGEGDGDAVDAAEFARLSARAGLLELLPGPQGAPHSNPPPDVDTRLRLPPLEHLVDSSGLPPTPAAVSAAALYAAASPLSPETKSGDEWKVRDYGYGLGRPRGGAQSFVPREYGMRPRRGSYNAAEPFDRGGFTGRRGRGAGRGFGRGSRGGYGGDGYGRSQRGLPRQHFAANIAGPSVPYDTTYYAVPPMPNGPYVPSGYEVYGQYPAAYGSAPPPVIAPTTPLSSAPVPVPITRLSFPLDPLRYYLLGQLEYYLSEDNLAHDLYLRKNMDAQGWIPISLLASFNRVKTSTLDLTLVRDVLTLSSLVEVKGEWVRTHRWKNYVLPDAPPSPLDAEGALPPAYYSQVVNLEETILIHPPSNDHMSGQHGVVDSLEGFAYYHDGPVGTHTHQHTAGEHEGDDAELEGEDEDEDDVVFVLGGDADQSWTQERKFET